MYAIIERLESRQLLAAGELDATYGGSGGVNDYLLRGNLVFKDAAVQSGGRLVVLARHTKVGGGTESLLLRFDEHGRRDQRFAGTQVVEELFAPGATVEQMVVLPDGRIVITTVSDVFGLTVSGKVDRSFGVRGRTALPKTLLGVRQMTAQPDGKILVAADVSDHVWIARFTTQGQYDPTFGGGDGAVQGDLGLPGSNSGRLSYARNPEHLVPTRDGRILVAGRFQRTDRDQVPTSTFSQLYVSRLTSTGEMDTTLDGDGTITLFPDDSDVEDDGPTGSLAGIAADDDDGGILLTRTVTLNTGEVVRFNADGTPDTAFGDGGRIALAEDPIHTARQSDGKLLVVTRAGSLHRFIPGGTPDAAFGTAGTVSNAGGAIHLGGDGTINQVNITSELVNGVTEYTMRISRRWSEEGPAGLLGAEGIFGQRTGSHVFRVTWRDDDAVDVATLANTSHLRVVAPDGTRRRAYLMSIAPGGSGTVRTATCKVAAPGDAWDATDNGTYRIEVLGGLVRDVDGAATSRRTLGHFRVAIPAFT